MDATLDLALPAAATPRSKRSVWGGRVLSALPALSASIPSERHSSVLTPRRFGPASSSTTPEKPGFQRRLPRTRVTPSQPAINQETTRLTARTQANR